MRESDQPRPTPCRGAPPYRQVTKAGSRVLRYITGATTYALVDRIATTHLSRGGWWDQPSDMTDDNIDISINGQTIDEAGAEIEAKIASRSLDNDERIERREARKLRRARARGWEDMLIQRDAALSRVRRLTRAGDDMVVCIEKFLDALSEGEDSEVMHNLRVALGDAIDDFDCEVGNLGGEDE